MPVSGLKCPSAGTDANRILMAASECNLTIVSL